MSGAHLNLTPGYCTTAAMYAKIIWRSCSLGRIFLRCSKNGDGLPRLLGVEIGA